MRLFSLFALLLFATTALAAGEPAVEIEFEYGPSFHEETLVCLVRLPDGKIHCEIFIRPELRVEEKSERKWKKLMEASVSPDVFARLEREFENPELKRAAEKDWSAVPDGSRWRLRRKKGSFTIEIIAHNPDMKEGAPIIHLARSISAATSADLFPK